MANLKQLVGKDIRLSQANGVFESVDEKFDYEIGEWEERSPGFFRREVQVEGVLFDQYLMRCKDCKRGRKNCVIDYMVKDDIWKKAVGNPKAGIVCMSCLEERLERKLEAEDLKNVPINRSFLRFAEANL